MAEIVNKKQPINPSVWENTNSDESKKRHDLYNHVSVDKLYGYNPVIMEIDEYSKAFFAQYITQGVKYWAETLQQCGFSGVDPMVMSSPNLCFIPLKKKEVTEDTDEAYFNDICFSVIEVLDPFDSSDEEEKEEQYKRLAIYISMGLFPLISEPMCESKAFYSFEKYDNLSEGRPIIGTIVNVDKYQSPIDPDHVHLVATVMWHPEFLNRYEGVAQELISPKSGYLHLVDMKLTPSVWKEGDKVSVTNIGVPIYEYKTYRQSVSEIAFTEGFSDYINEAVVTGNIKLDFVDTILHHTGETLSQIIEGLSKKEESASQTPENTGTKDEVPVENAADEDVFGHRLRLYDVDLSDVGEDEFPADFFYDEG